MKKNLIITGAIVLLGTIVIASASMGKGDEKSNKKKSKHPKEKGTIILIDENDTLINGKNFRDLSEKEKEEFLNRHKNFKLDQKQFELEMKEFSKDMEKLNKEMIVINDSIENGFSFSFSDEDGKVTVRAPKPPRAPKHMKHPKHPGANVEIPEIPELPEVPNFEFHFDDEVFARAPRANDENAQVYVFKDSDKNIVVKLMKANPKELKKIGAKNEEEIKMYPNPAKDEITLNFNFSESAPVTINIYDLEGKLIKSESIKDYKAGNYEKTFSMNDFENGSYLVEFVQNKTKIVRKLSIQR